MKTKKSPTMKRLLILVVLMPFAASAMAATVTLAWDPAPTGVTWEKVRAYEKSGATYTLLTEVAGNLTQCDVTVAPGAHSFVVRAYTFPWESGDSNTVSTPAVPSTPANLTISKIILAGIGLLGALVAAFWKRWKK